VSGLRLLGSLIHLLDSQNQVFAETRADCKVYRTTLWLKNSSDACWMPSVFAEKATNGAA